MKKVFVLLAAMIISGMAIAQMAPIKTGLPDAFKGGNDAMNQFFKDSLSVSPEIIKLKATGTAIFKFSADTKGSISKIVVCYADDYMLAAPAIEALKKSTGKWAIPAAYKSYDYVIAFSYNFTPSNTNRLIAQKAMYTFYAARKPILATDQIPLNASTFLPTIVVNYEQ